MFKQINAPKTISFEVHEESEFVARFLKWLSG